MLKVLIVDDEPFMRKGIFCKINWQAMQLECVGDAADGQDALQQIQDKKPDIVLTDIRMPVMDGLMLLERVRQIDANIQFVVISGYDDFQYARRAMNFGVVHYLLKPLNAQELMEVLEKLKAHFLAKDSEQDYRSLLLKHYEANRMVQRERMLTRRIQEEARERHDHEELAQIKRLQTSDFTLFVIRVRPFTFPHEGFHIEDEQLIWFGVQNIVEQLLVQSGHNGLAFRHTYHSDEMIAVLPTRGRGNSHDFPHIANQALDALRQYLQLEAAVGISNSNAPDASLKNAYEQARMAVRGEVLHGTGKVYSYSALRMSASKERASGASIIAVDQEMVFAKLLQNKDEERISRWLEQQYEGLYSLPEQGYLDFEKLSMHIYSMLRSVLSEYIDPSELILNEQQHFIEVLLSCRSWQAAKDALFQTARTVMLLIPDDKAALHDDVIDEVKHYIDHHYYENITLSWVADHYFIHPNYFCKLFKIRSGENFNNYLTQVRLSHAIRLMSNVDLKLAQIAGIVGYDSHAYFSSVFRKLYGISPKKYRENILASC
ncbi:response regulator [Paenibacillus sinopodophylli]|uniref:response regulator n=1 Tax=Paenibacillus sinopodophylli TaxID=1837342 RepID=UPI00110CC96E|nr:response regulator [Paenibacillus sinopodophylli]